MVGKPSAAFYQLALNEVYVCVCVCGRVGGGFVLTRSLFPIPTPLTTPTATGVVVHSLSRA